VTGVICSGNIVHDILVRPVDRVEWGTSMWMESLDQSLGGNGSNTAFAIGKLGARVKLLGWAGRDELGDRCLSVLQSGGVDVSRIERSDLPTAATVVLVNSSGERALLHRPGCSRKAFSMPLQFDSANGDGFGRYHLANVFALPLMRKTAAESLANARLAGLATSVDTGWDALGEWLTVLKSCLPHTDLLFVNETEARMLTGTDDLDDSARIFRAGGAGDVVIKLGAKGCVVFHGSERLSVPAFGVDVVDTTGAGDCFVGGFLAGLTRGLDIRECAELACAAGALSIQRLGAVSGLLDYAATRAWMSARQSTR
jgi:sugar/nucleoside kinase (ribokinase family)